MSRRNIVLAGRALLVGVLTTAALPAIAQGATSASASYAQFALKPPPGMLQALQRDLFLSREEAQTRLLNEARLVPVEANLRRTLGKRFAGSWFAGEIAQNLVVATTAPADVPLIVAQGARAEVVTRSLADLKEIKAHVDVALPNIQQNPLSSAPQPGSVRYIDTKINKVVVLSTTVNATTASLFDAGVDPVGIRVIASTEKPRPLGDLTGGDPYYIGASNRCSIGFAVTRGTEKGFVSAGHCGKIGNTTTGFNRSPQGIFQASVFPVSDYTFVLTNPKWSTTPSVKNGTGGVVSISGSRPAIEGASVCRSGSTTGWRCGTIQQLDTSVTYPQGTVYELVRTNVCAEPGDSGGSFISLNQAQGVTSGGSGDCSSGGTTYFQPVNEILAAYGLTLATDGTTTPPTTGTCTGYPQKTNGALVVDESVYQPRTLFYRTTAAGIHSGCLDSNDGGDFDLHLEKRSGTKWLTVVSADGPNPDETISYQGAPGFYRYRVTAASGAGTYVLGYKAP
ncbi:S1 family peptidase [Streptosporangium sp. NPDC050855]|uniref:S1 family peptidase n=1 Tax=Streptosporangium sp. NPDC050855 TaxID=3366194 RepID=UPI0037AF1516